MPNILNTIASVTPPDYNLGFDFPTVWTNFMAVLSANMGDIMLAFGIVFGLWFVIGRFNNATSSGRL